MCGAVVCRSGIQYSIASDYGISLQLRKRILPVNVVFCAVESSSQLQWAAVVSRSAFQQPTASYFYFRHLVTKLFSADLTRIVTPPPLILAAGRRPHVAAAAAGAIGVIAICKRRNCEM
ncbi:hypothetical protein TcasGA2_TC002650 [Tribolium castaneum]|nr:hypothetical protein TcasGA2_TC002650 [Tribolium castaneum]